MNAQTEQNSTHTPGPWRAICGKVTNKTGSHFIADCGKGDEPYANARLIAAAPDMLDLLVRISDSFPGYIPDFIEPVAKLRKKIEGRS